jgi:hypothetical protein
MLQVIAIKQLNRDGNQGNKEFLVVVLMWSVYCTIKILSILVLLLTVYSNMNISFRIIDLGNFPNAVLRLAISMLVKFLFHFSVSFFFNGFRLPAPSSDKGYIFSVNIH